MAEWVFILKLENAEAEDIATGRNSEDKDMMSTLDWSRCVQGWWVAGLAGKDDKVHKYDGWQMCWLEQ